MFGQKTRWVCFCFLNYSCQNSPEDICSEHNFFTTQLFIFILESDKFFIVHLLKVKGGSLVESRNTLAASTSL